MAQSGAWYTLRFEDVTEQKFQPSRWLEFMEDEKFKARIIWIMEEEVIMKFKNREGTASDFYEIDEEEVEQKSSSTV